MAYSQEKVAQVRGKYVYDRQPLKAAAELCGVPYNTARTWKAKASAKGDDWDTARQAARYAQGELGDVTAIVLEEFVLLFQSTIKEIKETKNLAAITKVESIARLSDAYVKTMKAAKGGDTKLGNLSVGMRVIEILNQFIATEYPELAAPFAEMLVPFGTVLTVELGE